MTTRIKSIFIFCIFAVLPFSTSFAQPLKAIAVSGGEQSSLVVAENNEVFSAGKVTGRSGDSDVFKRVSAGEMNTSTGFLENIIGVGAGWYHALALTKTGQALAWGSDSSGELGNGTDVASNYPVWVHAGGQNPSYPDSNLCNIVQVTAGRSGTHSLAVDSNNMCYGWGNNNMGQCSDTNSYYIRPKKVLGGDMGTPYLQNIIAVSAGEEHSMALSADGSVYTFGENSSQYTSNYTAGKLGIGDANSNSYRTTPVKVHGVNNVGFLADINSISAGWDHSMALQKYVVGSSTYKGRVYCWGNNGLGWSGYGCVGGRLGDGNSTGISATPVLVKAGEQNPGNPTGTYLEGIVAIAAGESHSMALDANGFVLCWGSNRYGQLGNGITTNSATPVRVVGFGGKGYLSNIVAISAGYWHCLAVDASGQLWVWGDWVSGQLGIAAASNKNTPYPAPLSDPNVWNKTQNEYYTAIQSAINDPCTLSGDTLVAYPSIYIESVIFGNKQLTLQSSNPADPLIVAQTMISYTGGYLITFTDNNSTVSGFTLSKGSRGVYCSGSSSPTVINCLIRDNIYGVFCYNLSAPTVRNCTITDSSYYGIFCVGAGQVKILNNWIVNNGSCGIYITSTNNELTIRNNTISNNFNGIYRSNSNDPNISNCIIWKNTRNNFSGTECNNVNYSCINSSSTGSYSGQYNITTDPCFVDDVNVGDYHLKSASLCRNAGDPNLNYDGETDIDDQPRRNGTARAVDIGADEYYGGSDLNGDGQVNFLDYAIFANAWKTYQGSAKWNAACDFIDDNDINNLDLAWFAQAWPFPPAGQQQSMMQQTEPEALEHFSSTL